MDLELITLVIDWLEQEFKDETFTYKAMENHLDIAAHAGYMVRLSTIPFCRVTDSAIKPWIWPQKSLGSKAEIIGGNILNLNKGDFIAADPDFFPKLKLWMILDVMPAVHLTLAKQASLRDI